MDKRLYLGSLLISFHFILLIFSFNIFSGAVGVTSAVDFKANDLAGNSHHLYSYLDAGKYVGLAFCANPIG